MYQTPGCKECSASASICWTKCDDGEFICNDCYVSNELRKQEERDFRNRGEKKQEFAPKVAVRKSARIRSSKLLTRTPKSPREKFVPKQINYTSTDAVLVALDSDTVYCNNQCFQTGDIVSFEADDEDNIHYAQVRGFLTDQYSRKSTVITWLVPTALSPSTNEGFDPSSYLIGAEEDTPRPLDNFNFVMHAPSEYYMISSVPDSPNISDPFKNGYVPDPSL